MRKLVSILLVFTLLTVSSFSVFASDTTSFDEGFKIYDEAIKDFITVSIINTSKTESRAQGVDSNNNVIYDYTYNAKGNYIYNNITKEKTVLKDDIVKEINNSRLNTMSSDMRTYSANGDPNYCTNPDPKEFGISLKLAANAGLASTAAVAVWLAPVLATSLGISTAAIKSAAVFSYGVVVGDIWSAITSGGDLGKDINFKAYYKCEHMCTWDGEEVCFYGDKLDKISYLGIY